MITLTAPFINMRLNTVIPGTKTRITISQYDDAWVWESDTDITDYLLMGQPNIDSELEEDVGAFKKDNLVIDLEDQAGTIRNLISTTDKYFLILFEKGFDGIADWVIKFDGIIDSFKTIGEARNIISITAYSMEEEFEMHPASDSASSGGVGVALATAVGDLFDTSYINIPGGNRIISVSPQIIPLCDYAGWTAREALDNLALVYGCVWKRTERDTAMFVSRKYIGGTLNLDTNLYATDFERYDIRKLDGVHAENTTAGVEAYSIGYVDGYNQDFNNQLLTLGCHQCHWSAAENYSFQGYNRRLFRIPGFYLLELEPLDRVNLTLRDKDGNLDETIFTQFTGSEYDDTNKITRVKLEERKPRIYERWLCCEAYCGSNTIAGNIWDAQTYTIGIESYGQNHNIISVKLPLCRTALVVPGDTVTVGIRNTAAGQPVGGDIASIMFPAMNLSLCYTFDWIECTFTIPAGQINGIQYAIVVRGAFASGHIRWQHYWHGGGGGSQNYTGGQEWTSADGGGTWTPHIDYDKLFECWGEIT